ncbi:MAG: hypothetical protein C0497_11125 [Gemmatimonas sp.]|nr:hypothetical protein [Gemmatimonas sp.]
MSEFALYLRMGYHHIAALGAWDHILFVAALTAAYGVHEWKRIAVLVTAFTLGHSITLALATYDLVRVSSAVVEPLFAFNVGLEVGQVLIVSVFFALGVAADRWLHVRRRDWVLILAGAAAGIGLTLLLDRLGNAA